MIKSGDEDIDGFRCDRLYDMCNFLRLSNARCIETIGPGFSVRYESVERGAQWIGVSDQPRFATSD